MRIRLLAGRLLLLCFLVYWFANAERTVWCSNGELSYSDLRLNQGYITGMIENHSSERQTDITVHIKAFTPDRSKVVWMDTFSIPAIEPKRKHFFKIPCRIAADPVFELQLTTPKD